MAGRNADGIPTPLEQARQRFERWRKTRRRGTRIPDRLWHAAVDMAGRYGVNRTAGMLGLDYYALKKRVENEKRPSRGAAGSSRRRHPVPTFVELPAAPVGATECVIEMEKACGTKMRVHLKGMAAADVVGLSRDLWGADS